MKSTLQMLAFAMTLALSTLHCGKSGSNTADGAATDSIAADSKPSESITADSKPPESTATDSKPSESTADRQLLFAGWVDSPLQPIVLSLEVHNANVTGTVTYAKFGKPIALKGTQTNGQFVLEEHLDGKQTGAWSFDWDMAAGSSDPEGDREASGKWRKNNTDPKALPVMLHPIRPLALSDKELKRRYDGSYNNDSHEDVEDIDAEGHEMASMKMTYVGSRHFSFSMETQNARSYGCGADGYLVMVAPDTAMFWGDDYARVRFVFHRESVSSQMLQWSSYYCGAGPTGFDAEMKKR